MKDASSGECGCVESTITHAPARSRGTGFSSKFETANDSFANVACQSIPVTDSWTMILSLD